MSTDKSAVAAESHVTPLQRRLREALNRKGMREREASRAAGAGLSFVSDILHGRSKSPSMSKILALADALEVEPEWLVDGAVEHHMPKGATEFPAIRNLSTMTAAENAMIPLFAAKIAVNDPWIIFGDRPVGQVKPIPSVELVVGAYAATVANNLNAPRYYAGETVFVSPAATLREGDFVMARRPGGSAAIGRLMALDSDGGAVALMGIADGELIEFRHKELDTLHKIVGSTS